MPAAPTVRSQRRSPILPAAQSQRKTRSQPAHGLSAPAHLDVTVTARRGTDAARRHPPHDPARTEVARFVRAATAFPARWRCTVTALGLDLLARRSMSRAGRPCSCWPGWVRRCCAGSGTRAADWLARGGSSEIRPRLADRGPILLAFVDLAARGLRRKRPRKSPPAPLTMPRPAMPRPRSPVLLIVLAAGFVLFHSATPG